MSVEPDLTSVDACPPAPSEFRRAIGAFASGVTVVTGADGDGPVGFVCQSFSSVSLEPPLILFCVGHWSRSWPRMRAFGRFCVNVLAEDQGDLCTRFGSSRGKKYDELGWGMSRWGTPSLPDVLLRVHAEVHAVHGAGDHDVVIGRVLETETGPLRRPMVFFRGEFGLDGDRTVWPDGAGLWGWRDTWE